MGIKVILRKTIGIILIIYGFFALVTPFTPGSWLIFIGLELLGIEILFIEKIKNWFKKGGKKCLG